MQVWLCALCALPVALDSPGDVPITVSVDMQQLSEQDFASLDGSRLERVLLVRLVQEGFAVVGAQQNPQITVVLLKTKPDMLISGRASSHKLERRVSTRSASPSELHFELSHRVLDLVRALAATLARPNDAVAPAVSSPPEPVSPLPVATRKSHATGLDARLGAMWRDSAFDATLTIGAQIDRSGDFALRLSAEVLRSATPALRIIEYRTGFLLSYRVARLAPLTLDVGLSLGVLVHTFALENTSLSESRGSRFDPTLDVDATSTYWLYDQLGLSFSLVPGAAWRDRGHYDDHSVLWYRGKLRIKAELGVVFVWAR